MYLYNPIGAIFRIPHDGQVVLGYQQERVVRWLMSCRKVYGDFESQAVFMVHT